MKKIFDKKTIFSFVLGIILCGGVVYAVNYSANDISYTKNGTEINVNEALDELYDITSNAATVMPSIEFQADNYLLINVMDFTKLTFEKNNTGNLNVYYLNESKQQLKTENWYTSQAYDIDLSTTAYLRLDYGYGPTFSNVKFE